MLRALLRFLTAKTSRTSAPFRVGYLRLTAALSAPLQGGLRFLRPLIPPAPSPFLTVGIPHGRDPAAAGGMGLPQLATEKLRAGEVGASDPVGVTDAAARWHLTRSYPLPFWARRVSLLSPISPYGPLMALHSRSTFPSSPSPLLP